MHVYRSARLRPNTSGRLSCSKEETAGCSDTATSVFALGLVHLLIAVLAGLREQMPSNSCFE